MVSRLDKGSPRGVSTGANPQSSSSSRRSRAPQTVFDKSASVFELGTAMKSALAPKGKKKETLLPTGSKSREAGSLESAGQESESESEVVGTDNEFLWKLVVGGICFLWGTNFATIRQIFIEVPDLDPSVYASWRFGIAALVFLPSFVGRLTDIELVKNSFVCGLFVFMGYIGQAIGLANGSTPEKSAFIAALCVVWVPILQGMLNKDFSKQKWGSTFLAITGIGLLELVGSSPPNIGDLWSLLQPLGFGSSYILIENACKALEKSRKEKLAKIEKEELEGLEKQIAAGTPTSPVRLQTTRDLPLSASFSARQAREDLQLRAKERAKQAEDADAAASSGLQIFSIALLSTAYALGQGHGMQDFLAPLQSSTATFDLLYTGLITTALAIYAQTVVSTKVKPTDIAIILAGEPIFATLCAAFLLHETVTSSDLFGGLLVVISCIGAEVDLSKK
jgi:drug/metabolite transporter (DMT)-like permease